MKCVVYFQHTPVVYIVNRSSLFSNRSHCLMSTSLYALLYISYSSDFIPMVLFLKQIKIIPCNGLVLKSATISSVEQWMMHSSFFFILFTTKKYLTLMCLLPFPVQKGQFFCNGIALLLFCRSKSSIVSSVLKYAKKNNIQYLDLNCFLSVPA